MKQYILSTTKLNTYKILNLCIWIVALAAIVINIVFTTFDASNNWVAWYWLLYWGFGFYILFIKRTLRLKSLSYDDENIYIQEKHQELIIPFLEIKHIKLRSVVGTHSIQLYENLGFGKEFFFKSSLWYPFNFKKIDEQVYELQKAIAKAKAEYQPERHQALGS